MLNGEEKELQMTLLNRLVFIILIVFIAMQGCSDGAKRSTIAEPDLIKDYEFTLVHQSYDKLHKNRNSLYNSYSSPPLDENGVNLLNYGGSDHYHPVYLCHKSLEALNDYYLSMNDVYLQHAIKCMEALRSIAVRKDDMIYFPYDFDYNESNVVFYTAPWFSGMAQGMALSAYSRLHHFTDEPLYAAVADSILRTMTDFEGSFETVLTTDEDSPFVNGRYYWIDEYPHFIKRYVLNGSIIGAMGLYDHWWVFGDDKSKSLFSKELTTIKDNVLLYRNPGGISFYDLHFKTPNTHYHQIHQDLLHSLTELTGDMFFSAIGDLFYSDYH